MTTWSDFDRWFEGRCALCAAAPVVRVRLKHDEGPFRKMTVVPLCQKHRFERNFAGKEIEPDADQQA